MTTLYAFLTSLALVAVYLWQDGIQDCPDGRRYTSGKSQPYPFHRRFCRWPTRLLVVVSLASMVMLGTLAGTWQKALILMTLPGAWLIATRPTCVDAPAMLLAWCSSLAWTGGQPWLAVLLSCCSGVIHERGPVFAALYSWSPWPLLGLLLVGWWLLPAPADDDPRVGRGFKLSLFIHRQDHDWLSWEQSMFALRGLPLLAAGYGVTPGAWVTLGVAWASRLVGSDLGRFVFWGAPVMVRDLPELPVWMVLLHAVTFRRMA